VISSVPWRLVPETGQLAARLAEPQRDLTIAWDPADRSLYLSVIAPAAPNVPGSQQRVYAAPVSLLAAMLIVPAELHAQLHEWASEGRAAVEGIVLEAAQTVVERAPQRWPEVAKARPEAATLPGLSEQLERLALDTATVDAFTEAQAV
jgi:hypothetical protein